MSNFYIHGFTTQIDIEKCLMRNEESMTRKEFNQRLLDEQNLDPENFYCADVSVAGEEYSLVITEHSTKRIQERSMVSVPMLRKRCAEILRNPLISSMVTEDPFFLDDDGKMQGSDVVVVDERTGIVYVFHAGFSYIYLATVWNVRSDTFYAHYGARVVKLKSDTFIETNANNIPEVSVKSEPSTKRNRTSYGPRTRHGV